jgi:hypothetical protein
MSMFYLDVPGFSLITSFSQNKQLILGVWGLGSEYLSFLYEYFRSQKQRNIDADLQRSAEWADVTQRSQTM